MLRNLAVLITLFASLGAFASSDSDSEISIDTYLKQLEGIVNAAQNTLGLGVLAANNSTVQSIIDFCKAYGDDCNDATVSDFNNYSEKNHSLTVVNEKEMVSFALFSPLDVYSSSAVDSNTPSDSLIWYVEQIKALCEMSSGNLQQRCLHDNKHIVKHIFNFLGSNSEQAKIEDFNVYLEKERKKGLDAYLNRRKLIKEGKQDITIKGKQFCSMYNSLLANSGLLGLLERLDIDKELPGYQRTKQELEDSLSGSKSIWAENCM